MGRIERDRHRELAETVAKLDLGSPRRKPAFIGQVINGGHLATVPTAFCLVNPIDLDGPETEGLTPTMAASSRTVPVLLLNAVPVVGEYLICRLEGDRWVADLPGGGGQAGGLSGSIPNCTCTTGPLSIAMTVGQNSPANLADPNVPMIYPSSFTLLGGPPAGARYDLGSYTYYGNEVINDTKSNQTYRYNIRCEGNYFHLAIVPADWNPFPSDYPLQYAQRTGFFWPLGFVGPGGSTNTCKPFELDFGSADPHNFYAAWTGLVKVK